MKFSIITPTFKRREKLNRAIESVVQQSHLDWEMIIINDNPLDGTLGLQNDWNDSRLVFLENEVNSGVNATRNRGLAEISTNSDYVIFLDDDDRLAPNALADLAVILNKTAHLWLVTARGITETTPTTKTPREGIFSYAWDYLITKKIKGDATHAIAARLIRQHPSLRFPTLIRQAEEWLFYCQLNTLTPLYYQAIVTTLTDGYADDGLNFRKRTVGEQLKTLPLLYKEGRRRGLVTLPFFLPYLCLRLIRAFIKK